FLDKKTALCLAKLDKRRFFMTKNKLRRPLKLTQDIVFKSFFSRNKQVLMAFLKNFLPISDKITDITILNPEKRDKENKLDSMSHSHKNRNPQNSNQTHENINSSEFLSQTEPNDSNNTSDKQQTSTLTNKQEHLSNPKNQLELKETSVYPKRLNKKQIVLDLRVKLNTGENINVEMQTISQKHFLKRILFYWAKLYSQDLEKGEDYNKINPAYSLIFTTFPVLDKQITDFISSFSIRRDKKPYHLFNEDLKIVIVELSKLTKSCNDLLDLKEKWCYFLRESGNITEEDYKYLSRDEEMKMALKHFNKLSKDEELYQEELTRQISLVAYNLDRQGLWDEGIQKGLQKGLKQGKTLGKQEGLAQGEFNKQKEIALNMLNKNLEVSFISEVTGLSEKEIKKLNNGPSQ
ncbi:MAG: Rpn family recombination-promoting nuclease/putative transposase, partial [Oligoflexia bacterium]|nr:Rpn family recombination-promoting nuclease/putative transposase [Oligoflexia bacterium]